MQSVKDYWEGQWEQRIDKTTGKFTGNISKLAKILYELMMRPGLNDVEKLDIGCGSGHHAMFLSQFYQGWKSKWTGIDLSEKGTACAKHFGFNAICSDLFEWQSEKKYEVIILLDSLEHFEDNMVLANKIKSVATDDFHIFGNVPLYTDLDAFDKGIERPMGTDVVKDFMHRLGFDEFRSEVYGIDGYPYMIFEA